MLERSSEFISQSNSKGLPTASEAYRSLQSISNLKKFCLEVLAIEEISELYEISRLLCCPNFFDGGIA